MTKLLKKTTTDDALLLYSELSTAEIRNVQRRLRAGELSRIAPGVVTSRPVEEWPSLVARERIRILATMFPASVVGYRSAFEGGVPVEGVMYLTSTYLRKVALPGFKVQVLPGSGPISGDAPMMGRNLFFPSNPRLLLENLTVSRAQIHKSAGRTAVEARLITICESRGEESLSSLREEARAIAPELGLGREFLVFEGLVGGILGTRKAQMSTTAGKAMVADIPYDAYRLELFEKLAVSLRATSLKQPEEVAKSEQGRTHFAFLESYFSNFIEGTEFDVKEARSFVLEGKPIAERPKDSHDILGVFRQALNPGWVNQTMAPGEAVLNQLRARHADQMKERPEVGPGEFKTLANRAGNTEFVVPRLVRGTLVEGSKLLSTVPAGTARALMAMFIVSEVHPFADGNGRLARLVMNSELSVVKSCRIIIPTLFREEYMDCLRVLTRTGEPKPFLDAMQKIHQWTAAFDYDDLDSVIAVLESCHAFEKSLAQFKLLTPT